jgi:acetyltransferase-like isoleucine patch superfamily enzyme
MVVDSNSMKNTWKKPEFEHSKLTKYNYVVQYPENLKFGTNIDIGTFSYLNCQYGITIEDNVQIGSHCSLYSHSTIDSKKGAIILQKNCKVGTHSTIMPGVTIGENSVVAAYSFVTKSVSANQLCGGVPAKFLKNL